MYLLYTYNNSNNKNSLPLKLYELYLKNNEWNRVYNHNYKYVGILLLLLILCVGN